MDLVDEEHVPFFEGCQQPCQIPGTVEHGTGGDLHIHPHLVRDDMCQGGFPEAGRAVEQSMVESLPTELGCLDVHLQIRDDFPLSGEIFELPRADNSIQFLIFAFVCIVGVEIRHLPQFLIPNTNIVLFIFNLLLLYGLLKC